MRASIPSASVRLLSPDGFLSSLEQFVLHSPFGMVQHHLQGIGLALFRRLQWQWISVVHILTVSCHSSVSSEQGIACPDLKAYLQRSWTFWMVCPHCKVSMPCIPAENHTLATGGQLHAQSLAERVVHTFQLTSAAAETKSCWQCLGLVAGFMTCNWLLGSQLAGRTLHSLHLQELHYSDPALPGMHGHEACFFRRCLARRTYVKSKVIASLTQLPETDLDSNISVG